MFKYITQFFTAIAVRCGRVGRYALTMEFNKIAAAVLFTLFALLVTRSVSDMIYNGGHHGPEKEAACYYEEFCQKTDSANAPKAAPIDPMMLIATADPARGEKFFANCKACHTKNSGGKHGTGPNLWNILDAPKASQPNFKYSDALKARGGTWDYENLYQFLLNPKKYEKGTAMNFGGLKKPGKAAAMVAYLRQQHDNPPALPEYTPPMEEVIEVEGQTAEIQTEPTSANTPTETEPNPIP